LSTLNQFQGKEEKVLQILRKIYKINTSNDPKHYLVSKIIEDFESIEETSPEDNSSPFQRLVTQTKSLFSGENLKKTVLVCVVQFLLFAGCHGLYMFFPEIVDKVTTYTKENPPQDATLCEIYTLESLKSENQTASNEKCDEKIEVAAFGFTLMTEILYMFGFLIITFVINRVSKLSILLTICLGCSLSGFSTLLVKIPIISISFFVVSMVTVLGVNVVGAATCNLYPTKLRGIALNVTMMFGRIGSVVGTFTVGQLLDQNCELTFGLSASLVFLCGVLIVFIPEIRKIEGRQK
jgi:MFS transporter, VNT family, synaptic vesicle glycoprotein 2